MSKKTAKAFDADLGLEDLQLETLMGDVRDAVLGRIREMRSPWSVLPQGEQAELAEGVEYFARQLIARMVTMLNKHEWPHVVVQIGEMKVKGEKGIEAKISCSNIEHNRSVLGDHVGASAMLLMVDSETFFGEREPARTDPDQPVLPGTAAE